MGKRLLFLLGGTDAGILDKVAEEFVPAAGGREANLALLMMGGERWEDHVPEFTNPWIKRGVKQYHTIVPGADGNLEIDDAGRKISEVSGIFIAGGHTPTYHRLYAAEPMRSLIRRRYQEGMPIAGVSAGALILPEICVLASERLDRKEWCVAEGLGLIRDLLIGVHFSSRDALPIVLKFMQQTQTPRALGLDDGACGVFENEQLQRILGQEAYEIIMTDFTRPDYGIKKS